MVGDPRGRGGPAAGLTAGMRAAYEAAAPTWRAGPERVYAVLARALLAAVRLRTLTVRTGISAPAQLASWRLGMAHIAPFVRSLDSARRAAVQRAAVSALTGCEPLVVSLQVPTAT
jgi:hypothetical protein